MNGVMVGSIQSRLTRDECFNRDKLQKAATTIIIVKTHCVRSARTYSVAGSTDR